MREGGLIFNLIDAQQKYMGFTMFEIITVIVVMLSGFILNLMIMATLGCFVSIFVIRFLNHLLKISSFKRMLFYYCSDLFATNKKRINAYSKYYL